MENPSQRVLGVDPGTLITGWGVVEMAGGALVHVAHGTIKSPPRRGHADRLSRVHSELKEILRRFRPEVMSLEKLFFARNAQSALKLGQARGVAMVAAAELAVPVHEYSSAEIKLAVVGYGRATKAQVQHMVGALLRVPARIPGDAADALAAAICDLHQSAFHKRVLSAAERGTAR